MNINQYIIENSLHGADDSFLRRFSNAEVFFSLESSAITIPDGPMQIHSDTEIRLKIARLDFGNMGIFYASRNDPRLGIKFAGMPLIRAAQMVCDSEDIDGILLQSDGDAWLAAKKEVLRRVIGQVRDNVFYRDLPPPSKNS